MSEKKLCVHLRDVPFAEPGDKCPECEMERWRWLAVESKLDLVGRLRYIATNQHAYDYSGPPHEQPCRCVRCLCALASDALVTMENELEETLEDMGDRLPYKRRYDLRRRER